MQIGVMGPKGRMGRAILAVLKDDPFVSGTRGLVRAADPDAGSVVDGTPFFGPSETFWQGLTAVIDFTQAEATLAAATQAKANGVAHIVGTTGLTSHQEAALIDASGGNRTVYAPNMALGVNLLLALVEQAAAALDLDWDIEVVEMHHRHKKDAPSGTALGLGRAAARGRGVALDTVQRLERAGDVGARPEGEIGFATLRGGDIVGDHSVHFATTGECLTLSHRATDRSIFARGAVRAAKWASDKPAGFYTMRDVLGLG